MQFQIDLRGLVGLDPMRSGFAVDGAPTRRSLGPIERQALRASLSVAGRRGRLAEQTMEVGNGSRHSLTLGAPGRGLTFALPASTSIFTVAAGVNVGAFAGVGVGFGGVYGSNKPESGLFICANDGVFLNVGVSAGAQLTWVFGPPSTFAGVSWGAGVSVDIPGVVSVGGAVWFSLVYRPHPILTLIAVSVDASFGISVLPLTFSLQRSRTRLIPHHSASSGASRGGVAATATR
jgi:hypothetical protein